MEHIPVMAGEVVRLLVTDRSGTYLDGTCGLGGHARLILTELSSEGKLICIDRDVEMLEAAKSQLRSFGNRVRFQHCSYDDPGQISALSPSTLAGVLLDLGLCSAQLDDEQRGFSHRFDSPLDMRFDRSGGKTAADYVNTASEQGLVDSLRSFGDFANAKSLAGRIVKRRSSSPLRTVGELVSCVEDLFPHRLRNKLAARFMQSIRIAVNAELDRLDRALPELVSYLTAGGRFAVISYHSHEDRRIKRFFRQSGRASGLPPDIEACMKGMGPALRPVTRRAIKPTDHEVDLNPRARSARLRVAERLV
jgi:16S rRNA (cytosine1402-N4)-methyltransferase